MILVTQFLSRKFEAIYNNRPNKKTKFFLQDPTKELFKIFCLSFVFQNQYFSEILMGGQPLDDEISKQYIANVKNFLKIINGLGLYDKKLEIMKEFFQSIRSPKLLQTIQLFLAGIVTRFKSESAHNTEENAIRALTEILGFAIVHLFDFKNPFAGTEDMEGVQKYAAFFAEQNLLCSNVGEYDTLLGTLVKLFTHVMGRAESLQITELYNTNDKDPGSLLVDLAVNQIQTQFKLASVYFLFNKYDQSIECIISAWHMSIQQKSLLLNSLPKQLLQKEQILLIFSSLFARKGYAESLIVSQFLDFIVEHRKLQRYILKFINYIPKHLIEFLISPGLIEEILNKNSSSGKNESIDKILVKRLLPKKKLIDSPELYQVNHESRKSFLCNYKRIMFLHYLFSIKINK